MRWSPSTVAGFAQNAGFGDDELVMAVAVALAASDGWDDVWNEVDPMLTERLVGLWQVPTWLVSEETSHRLTNPVVNAEAAFRLWLASDCSWNWSPTFAVGGWKYRIPEARAAVQSPQMGESIVVPVMPIDTTSNRLSARSAIRRLIEQVNGFSRATRHD